MELARRRLAMEWKQRGAMAFITAATRRYPEAEAGEIPKQKQLLLTQVPPPLPEELDEDLLVELEEFLTKEHPSQRSEVLAVGSRETREVTSVVPPGSAAAPPSPPHQYSVKRTLCLWNWTWTVKKNEWVKSLELEW